MAHRTFWDLPIGKQVLKVKPAKHRTITELIFVPNTVKDGLFLLDLQVAPFALDAAPSRPVLYPYVGEPEGQVALPPCLVGTNNWFTMKTVNVRLPKILESVMSHFDASSKVYPLLQSLFDEMAEDFGSFTRISHTLIDDSLEGQPAEQSIGNEDRAPSNVNFGECVGELGNHSAGECDSSGGGAHVGLVKPFDQEFNDYDVEGYDDDFDIDHFTIEIFQISPQ